MFGDKFSLFKYIFSKELKSKAGRINLSAGGILAFIAIILSPTIKIKDIFFYGVEGYPTKFVIISIFVYFFVCVFVLIIRDSIKKNSNKK